MICAGAGIAPFMGFVAHRAAQLQRDPSLALAPALLFVGCRAPRHAPYAAELERGRAVVDVRYAYSRESDGGPTGYVQDRVWADREELIRLWEAGARVYVCGSRAVSQGVKQVVWKIYQEVAQKRCGPRTEAQVSEWWLEILKDRYAVDVF